MLRMSFVAVVAFIAGALGMALLSKTASEARDRAIASTFLATQVRSASQALAIGDLNSAERYQRNAVDTAEGGTSALAMDIAPWTIWFPLATGIVDLFASDAETDRSARRQQEIGLRRMHADLLDRLNRPDEAKAQRLKVDQLKK